MVQHDVQTHQQLLQQNQALQRQLQQAQLRIAELNAQVNSCHPCQHSSSEAMQLHHLCCELRSTFSNIGMAIQMLEIMLKQLGQLRLHSASIDSYFQLIKEECFNGTQLVSQLPDETFRFERGTFTNVDR